MRHLLTIIIAVGIGIALFMTVDWKDTDFSLSLPSVVKTASGKQANHETASDDRTEPETADELWIDTVMFAKGHAFGYSGDISEWSGWYFDTIFVGYDPMLTYDSIGPSTLKLNLVTKELTVNLGEPDALAKIKSFMAPIEGCLRYQKSYQEALDSVEDEELGVIKFSGGFDFTADYADSSNENRDKINRFLVRLADASEAEKAHVSSLTAFYAGFSQTKYYRPVFTGNCDDMAALSDYLAHKTFENWIRGGVLEMGYCQTTLTIKPQIANERYVTFSKHEYEREGVGHGMYTQTFHTLNLKTGEKLSNNDIFNSQSLNKVKMRLFEVMAKDPKYVSWRGEDVSPKDIESMIEGLQEPLPFLEGTIWEEPDREIEFELPDGALTESGVVFSFQPYEIGGWVEGAYHFIIPYKKLTPYLTPEAKRLITGF